MGAGASPVVKVGVSVHRQGGITSPICAGLPGTPCWSCRPHKQTILMITIIIIMTIIIIIIIVIQIMATPRELLDT